jgi:hypothetical protein
VIRNLAGGLVPDVVDVRETYGVVMIVLAQLVPMDEYATDAQLGAGVYTADAVAERFGVRSTIVSMGA